MNIGLAGEVRYVITKADGTVKEDTGYQKNVILNQGLEFFGGGRGSYINYYCVIGNGNSVPSIEQTNLDSYITSKSYSPVNYGYSYVDNEDDLYKTSMTCRYRFDELDNVNISEVGLASEANVSTGTYYLCTRALLKDSTGNATTITVLADETLDIYYKIWKVVSTLDTTHVINVLDGEGGSTPYNVTVRPARVGTEHWRFLNQSANNASRAYINDTELGAITSVPSGYDEGSERSTFSYYTPGSYKTKFSYHFELSTVTRTVRSICQQGGFNDSYLFFPFQARFGSVEDDSPIVKTDTHILTIPFEVSWGRYEGEL